MNLLGVDHLMVCVKDLDEATNHFNKLGFDFHYGGRHEGKGTHNSIAFFQEDFLELIACRDKQEYFAASPAGSHFAFVEEGGGIRFIALETSNIEQTVESARSRGFELSDPSKGSRKTPDGRLLEWKVSILGKKNPLPLFFIQHITPLQTRKSGTWTHTNIHSLERVYIVVKDLPNSLQTYSSLLDLPIPPLEKGQVVKSDMHVFPLPRGALVLAHPTAPGKP